MSDTSMRALVAGSGGALSVETLPRPEPGPQEVRLRVLACGICGSDLHLRSAGLLAPGLTPGHEFVGAVDALGGDVEGVAVGDTAAVEPFRSCGHCRECRAGRDPLCAQAKLLGIHSAGGLAEYVVVPARRLYRCATDLEPAVAALAEPTAVVLHGLDRLGDPHPERLLVLGAGSVGLLTLLAARARGIPEVWITARHPHQRELAQALGATRVLDESEANRAALDALGREQPFDGIVESVGGQAETLLDAAAAARPGATISVLGVFLGELRIDPLPLLLKELTLAWSYCYQQAHEADFARAVKLLDEQRDAAALLGTHQLPLEEAPRAFELAADRRAGAVKVSVLP